MGRTRSCTFRHRSSPQRPRDERSGRAVRYARGVSIDTRLAQDSGSIPELVHLHAVARPTHPAVIAGDDRLDFAGLDARMDQVAAALQRDGVATGGVVAIAASSSIAY